MTTHVPASRRHRCGVLLDGEAIAKALSRIAHEMIERTDDSTSSRSSGSSRAARLSPRASAGSSKSAAASRLPSARWTSRSTATTSHVRDGGRRTDRQPVVRSTSISFPIEGMTVVLVDDVLYTGGRSAPRSTRSSSSDGPHACSSRFSSTAGIASSRSAPTTSERTSPPAGTSGSRSSWSRVDERDGVFLIGEREDGERV